MADFGEDALVSLGKYFWSRKEKIVVKKGAKRTRKCTINQVPPIIISPLSVEVPISQSQPDPSVTVQEGTISTTEEMDDFGKDAVVSLGNYFWSRKEKVVVKKGAIRGNFNSKWAF